MTKCCFFSRQEAVLSQWGSQTDSVSSTLVPLLCPTSCPPASMASQILHTAKTFCGRFWMMTLKILKRATKKKKSTNRLISNTLLITEDHLKLALSLLHSCSHLYAGTETRAHWHRCITHWLIRSPQWAAVCGFCHSPSWRMLLGLVEEPQLNFRGHYLGLVLALSSASHLLILHQHYQAALPWFTLQNTTLWSIWD